MRVLVQTTLLLFLGVFSNSTISQIGFLNWTDYEYTCVIYTSNKPWTKWIDRVNTDLYGHVPATRKTLQQLGVNVLPEDFDQWGRTAVDNPHKILFIDIRHVTATEVVWRYSNWGQLQDWEDSCPPGEECLMELTYSENTPGRRWPDCNADIQEQWKSGVLPFFPENSRDLVKPQKLPATTATKAEPEIRESSVVDYKGEIDALRGKAPIFGLYRGDPLAGSECPKYKLAVTEREGQITAIVTDPIGSWSPGETKGVFTPTGAQDGFITDWYMGNKSHAEGISLYSDGMLTVVTQSEHSRLQCSFIKTYPLVSENGRRNATSPHQATSSTPTLTLAGSGSAVVIDAERGFLVTNHHVATAGSKLRIAFKSEEYDVDVVALDEPNDLALLRLRTPPSGIKGLPISINDKLGDRIVTAGYPLIGLLGSDIKVTEGMISSTSYLGSSNMYQISASITNGSSGGALLDESGNLAGITQGGIRPDENTENVNSAVKSLMILTLVQGQPDCEVQTGDLNSRIDFESISKSVVPVNIYIAN